MLLLPRYTLFKMPNTVVLSYTKNGCCKHFPFNQFALEKTVPMVAHSLEDVDGCDLCRAAMALWIADVMPDLYRSLLQPQESVIMASPH